MSLDGGAAQGTAQLTCREGLPGADGSLVIDIGEIIGSTGSRSKYVVVYRRLTNGSLRIAVDAASSVSEQPTAE